MGLMDLFWRKRELRSSGTGYTAAVIAARDNWIRGDATVAELTSAVQVCVGLWEGAFTLSDVKGTPLLDRHTMALAGRALALRGEAVFLIGPRVVPFIDWSLTTRNGIPVAYRGTIPDVSGSQVRTVLAQEVLHLRIASDIHTPWAGRSPLSRVPLSASLLGEVEGALRDVFRDAPLGSLIVPVPEGAAEDMAQMRAAFKGKRGSSLIMEGVAQATAAGMNPNIGRGPDQLSPDLSKSMTGPTLDAARDAIMLSYGVLPALINRSVTGPAVREAQRHLAQIVLQPIAQIIAEEATAKLGGAVTVDVVRPMQAYDQGGKARALSTMIAALAQAKEAGIDGAALQDALSFIDWAEE